MVFDAGTLPTTFVGLLKATTVILFFGTTFVFVPIIWRKSYKYWIWNLEFDPDLWMIPLSIVLGVAPLIYVLWASAPFVVSAYLVRVPLIARRSTDHLMRWTEKLPHDTEIEFKMFSWYGFFRRTTVPLLELRKRKSGLGIQNLVRLNASTLQPKLFYIGKEGKEGTRTRLWDKISAQIEPVGSSKKA